MKEEDDDDDDDWEWILRGRVDRAEGNGYIARSCCRPISHKPRPFRWSARIGRNGEKLYCHETDAT